MQKIIGIDLGTTNSVVAVMLAGLPSVICNSEGNRTTPSILAYARNKDLLVGQIAKRQSVINPENTFYSIKRFIGCKFDDIEEESLQIPYKIKKDSKGNIKVICPILGKNFSPEELSAQILRKLANDASTYLGQSIEKAVITVPAYFNDSQRQATKDAGKIAGLEVVRIINEPTAASLAYGLDKKQNETILVFDLGGGTFDVSVLEVGDGVFEVLATAGDTHLGGDDFDRKIVNFLLDDFQSKNNISLREDSQALQRLTEAAEKAKVELSDLTETTINLPFITANETGPMHIEKILTRTKFQELCNDLISRVKVPVETAIREARIRKEKIDEVVLVGGSTRIPIIKNLVTQITGKNPNQTVNPDEVVAIGAAVQGGVLSGEIKDILLLDVTPLSLGVETFGGVMTNIITRNTTIPAINSDVFSTASDNQTTVEVIILQGERPLAEDNKRLGSILLEGIPPAPKAVPQIEVKFDIDVNGILSVIAKDQGTNKEKSISIKDTSVLSKSEVDRLVREAEIYAQEDKIKRDQIEIKNRGTLLVADAEKQLNSDTNNLTLATQQKLLTGIKNLQDDMQNNEFQSIQIRIQELEKILAEIKKFKDIPNSKNVSVRVEDI
jgi:molecular chaperone DnaK